jgi:NAD(P)-dependent dehydrogenase (short-subunit alcohol dehydrogenase family)
MGEATVRQFAVAGAYVTIADVNVERGEDLARELAPNAQFVKCNTVSWDEQVAVFEAAIANSPSKSCDVVIANAGISRASGDSLWPLDGASSLKYPTLPYLQPFLVAKRPGCVCVHANDEAQISTPHL